MPKYSKTTFSGGINQGVDATKINLDTEVYLLSNGRVRNNTVRPVREPRNITNGLPYPNALIQGIYAVNNFQIVFVNGKAFYKNFDPEQVEWSYIPSLQMSATAPRIYLELVPASYVNRVRKITDRNDAKSPITLGSAFSGSPQCGIAMDGVSQPWKIFPDATAQITQTYVQWNSTLKEYVPLGILPMYHNGKLYCVGKDSAGAYTRIYHSVSGRPLDFVIPVNEDGNKIGDENDGGAPAMAYKVDFGDITALRRIEATDGAFYAGTVKSSYLVLPDTTNLIYGEPTFSNQYLFGIGPLNEQCLVELRGDVALIHYAGIRSFNGTLALKFRGKNAPFSRQINNLLEGITQGYGAAIAHDNYAVFAVKTKYGPAILWYDTLLERFVSVDQFPGIGQIKQFSSVLTKTASKLYFITEDNQMFEYDAGETVATCRLYLADLSASPGRNEHRVTQVAAQFVKIRTSGFIQATAYADHRIAVTQASTLTKQTTAESLYESMPFNAAPAGEGEMVVFDFSAEGENADKVGALLEWNADAELVALDINTTEAQSLQMEGEKYQIRPMLVTSKLAFIGNDSGADNDAKTALNSYTKLLNRNVISGGNNDITAWSSLRSRARYNAVTGALELDNDTGQPFREAMLQAPTRYFKIETTYANFFMMNSGYNSAGTQVEPDNLDETTIAISRQWQWLKRQLANSITKFNVIVMYDCIFSSTTARARALLTTIPLRTWGAHLVLTSAAKNYERIYDANNALLHINNGTASGVFETPTAQIEGSYKLITNVAGALLIEARPLSMELAFTSADGKIHDYYTLRR